MDYMQNARGTAQVMLFVSTSLVPAGGKGMNFSFPTDRLAGNQSVNFRSFSSRTDGRI